ncbi:MAG: amino acid permease [Pseudomonadales bacterium]|nr:amino acid permease [Pseudomonadales bacterium]
MADPAERPIGSFSGATAAAVVVANMIGTGVFTSLGFQLLDIQSGFVLIMLWVVGGVTALCGALTYAELGAALPRSGGEYNFLSRIYHPAAGFISGWVSATIGFAAPVALAAITFGSYLSSVFPALSPTWLACGLVLALTLVHASTRGTSGGVQRWFTVLKIALIVVFCLCAALLVDDGQPVRFRPAAADADEIFSAAFAVALIYVNYAYTGWNAATYLTSELDDPERNLPRVLGIGTAVVLVLYVWLNYSFLHAAPQAEMAGKVEVGYVAATFIFGPQGAAIMGTVLALLLVSTVSAMTLAGPRVLQVIGQDFAAFRWLARTNGSGLPAVAIAFQSTLALAFILTASFESILVFAGFTLGLNSFLAVAGVFVLRWRQPDLPRPYRTFAYPLPPLIYLGLTGWTLVYLLLQRPAEAGFGLAIVVSGALFYALTRALGTTAIADPAQGPELP